MKKTFASIASLVVMIATAILLVASTVCASCLPVSFHYLNDGIRTGNTSAVLTASALVAFGLASAVWLIVGRPWQRWTTAPVGAATQPAPIIRIGFGQSGCDKTTAAKI